MKSKMKPITIEVIFRKFNSGEIIALFPYDTGHTVGQCNSYMYIGQHSDASLYLVRGTKLAKPDEYKELLEKLKRVYAPTPHEPQTYEFKVMKKVQWFKHCKAVEDRRK